MNPLSVYLRNHWAASAAGADLAQRVAGSHDEPELRQPLEDVAAQIREDRASLREIMSALGVAPDPITPQVARLAERVSRLKPNGRLVRRSPVSDVIEIESLRSAVVGKRAGWEALSALSRSGSAAVPSVERLIARADDQLAKLAEVHRLLAVRRLDGHGG